MAAPSPSPVRWLRGILPTTLTPSDIICIALYALAKGEVLRGSMVSTVADQLGIDFYRATEMAEAAHAAGLVRLEQGTVLLTSAGWERGAKLTPLAPATMSAGAQRPRMER